jgi:hypothetical protein
MAKCPIKEMANAAFRGCDAPTPIVPLTPFRRLPVVSQDINVLALVKGNERYVFIYDDASRAETLRTLGRYASNPDLSFTWYDAAVLSQKIRQDTQQFSCPRRFDLPLPTDSDDF